MPLEWGSSQHIACTPESPFHPTDARLENGPARTSVHNTDEFGVGRMREIGIIGRSALLRLVQWVDQRSRRSTEDTESWTTPTYDTSPPALTKPSATESTVDSRDRRCSATEDSVCVVEDGGASGGELVNNVPQPTDDVLRKQQGRSPEGGPA